MKTVSLIFLLMQLLPYKPQSEYVNGLSMQSTFYHLNPHVVFMVDLKGDGIVNMKICMINRIDDNIKEVIMSSVGIFTNNGNFELNIYKYDGKYAVFQIPIIRDDFWKSIDSGIRYMEFYTNKNSYRLPIRTNLKQLKDFANGKEN